MLTLEGAEVLEVEQLVDGGCYVVSSTSKLRHVDYMRIAAPAWNNTTRTTTAHGPSLRIISTCTHAGTAFDNRVTLIFEFLISGSMYAEVRLTI